MVVVVKGEGWEVVDGGEGAEVEVDWAVMEARKMAAEEQGMKEKLERGRKRLLSRWGQERLTMRPLSGDHWCTKTCCLLALCLLRLRWR